MPRASSSGAPDGWRPRVARSSGRRDRWQSALRAMWPWRSPPTRYRSSAATGTSRSTRSRNGSATRRSIRSGRGPRRFSGSSSRALSLARQGADVVITDVLVEDDPDLQKTAEAQGSALAQFAVSSGWVHSNATAEEIRKMGRRSLAIKMDVTNREQIRDVFKKVKDEFGKIDILINNAATLDHAAQIPNQSYELWDRDVKVNLTGAFNCTKEVWSYMAENKWGRLIFMSSVAGTLGGFGQASYSATKAGLIGLAKTAALEGGRHNITSNAIAPGIIESEAGKAAAQTNPLYERFKARTVFKRFGQPEDIANTIAFLCSDEAGYITGAVIEVAGGIPLFTA